MWGRGHFVDSSVIFDQRSVSSETTSTGNVFLIRDGIISDRSATFDFSKKKRDLWGLSVPQWISLVTEDNIRILIKPSSCIRSGFSDVKMLCEILLNLDDGKIRKTVGITEMIDPTRLNNRLFRMISDLEIGREGRSQLF